MGTDTVSSLSITNLDGESVANTNIIVANTTGVGAAGALRETSDYVTPTALGLQTTLSTYKLVRLPMYAKVKALELKADAALDTGSALVVDVGAYYSDSAYDGTPVALQGTKISANCFAAAIEFGPSGYTDHVAADTAWTLAERNEPLWVALGLTAGVTGAPPGGFIDVVLAVHTAATTGALHNFGISVKHVA